MSSLEDFRDHCHRLSEADHRDDCTRIHRIVKVDRYLYRHGLDNTLSCPDEREHDPHGWDQRWTCPGLCGGCMPDAERELWRRLADEVDAYLADEKEAPLW